jgi:SdrD B-like domain/IPTL-CTERM motif
MDQKIMQSALISMVVRSGRKWSSCAAIVLGLAAADSIAAITGVVYQDFNSNGVRDTTTTIANDGAAAGTIPVAVDRLLAGVIVTATCVTGNGSDGVYGTGDDVRTTFPPVTTDGINSYSITTTGAVAGTATNPSCRVSFSWDSTSPLTGLLPNPLFGMYPSFSAGTGANPSNTGTQFVGPNATADLGLNYPADFCQNNPELAVTCSRYGGIAGPTSYAAATGASALVMFPYSGRTVTGGATTTPPPDAIATFGQLGSTYGLAYHKPTGKLLVGAYLKRHIGVGPGGLGQIYIATPGTTGAGNFLNLETLIPGSAGANPRVTPAPAAGQSPTDPSGHDYDLDASVVVGGDLKVGKVGIGDLDFSEDGQTLYAIGLNSRKLYSIPVGNGLTAPAAGAISTISLPDPGTGATGCPLDPATPAGELNLNLRPFAIKANKGFVYVGMTCTAEVNATRADLKGFVYRYDGSTFTQVFNTSFAYGLASGLQWNAWTDVADSGASGCCFERPEPLLSDIEFSASGDMILSVRDRTGDTTGRGSLALTGGGRVDGRAHGDLIRACVDTATGVYSPAACTTNGINWFFDGGGAGLMPDANASMGSLLQVPGFRDVVQTVKDPTEIYSNGVVWHNTETGAAVKGYEVLTTGPTQGGVFINGGKANGMGDLEALCDAAPLEVGNRVWLDVNGNGLQDAGEPPVAGVTVNLYAPGGSTPIATAVTDANGNYYFSNKTSDENGVALTLTNGGATVNAITALTTETAGFQIRFDNAADYGAAGPLANLRLTTPNASGVTTNSPLLDLTDSDATLATPANPIGAGNFPTITFNTGRAGENNFGLDVGFIEVYSVGNRVFIDTNNNGTQDATENGLAGVTVRLLNAAGAPATDVTGAAVPSVTTDSAGYYRFDNLPPGNYIVEVQRPAGYASSTDIATSADPNNNTDRDDNGVTVTATTVRSAVVTLGSSAEPTNDADRPATYGVGSTTGTDSTDNRSNLSVDFGFVPAYALGNRIWYDTNNNGMLDAGELPIAGVLVELLDNTGAPTGATATTNGSGYYLFDGLLAGTYSVRVAASNWSSATGVLRGYTSSGTTTSTFAAGDNSKDHGVDPATAAAYPVDGVKSAPITLGAGAISGEDVGAGVPTSGAGDANDNLTVDFGFYRLTVGNEVFRDTNNNGLKDGTDAGIDGVKVELLKNGVVVATTTTAGGGLYTFNQGTDAAGVANGQPLLPGTDYTVRLPGTGIPAGFSSSGDIASTANPTAAGNGTNNDDNGIGTGSANIVSNAFALQATTTLPAGAAIVDAATAVTGNPTIDFGLAPVPGVNVGNYVWIDANKNGIQDAGETPVQGVTATISKVGGGVVRDVLGTALTTTQLSQLTSATGSYGFTNLEAGQYIVTFSGIPVGYAPTTTNAPTSTTDNDSNGLIAQSRVLAAGESDLSLDLGISQVAGVSVGNFVWSDNNGNGIQDAGELGVGGVTATVTKVGGGVVRDVFGNPVTVSQQTDQNGLYSFTNLEPGQYTVTFSTLPPAYSVTTTSATGSTPSNDSNGLTATSRALVAGESDPTLDLGIVPRYALGNRVWLDGNNNGVVDAGEVGLDGLVVRLLDANGATLTSTTTSGGGYYLFANLAEGKYQVEIDPPTGHVTSTGKNGDATGPYEAGSADFTAAGDNKDHGTKQASGAIRSAIVMLAAGMQPTGEPRAAGSTDATPDDRTNLTVDFGLFVPAKLGNLVWIDNGNGGGTANNGKQDGTEPGLNGVTVRVLNAAGTVLASTVTSNNPVGGAPGWYEISNLVPGQYQAEFVAPDGYTFTSKGAAAITTGTGTDTSNSQATAAQPRTALVTLAAGDNNPQLDAGLIAAAPTSIPTLNEWMMMLMAMLMVGVAATGMRRR